MEGLCSVIGGCSDSIGHSTAGSECPRDDGFVYLTVTQVLLDHPASEGGNEAWMLITSEKYHICSVNRSSLGGTGDNGKGLGSELKRGTRDLTGPQRSVVGYHVPEFRCCTTWKDTSKHLLTLARVTATGQTEMMPPQSRPVSWRV